METVAVYEERPIRAYTLQVREGVCLVSASWPLAACCDLEQQLCRPELAHQTVFCQTRLMGDRLYYLACLKQEQHQRLSVLLAGREADILAGPIAADLIHLQGPHYGDRYGIAAAAAAALDQAGLVPLALAGVVHSLFIAVAAGQGGPALAALAEHFTTPKGGSRP